MTYYYRETFYFKNATIELGPISVSNQQPVASKLIIHPSNNLKDKLPNILKKMVHEPMEVSEIKDRVQTINSFKLNNTCLKIIFVTLNRELIGFFATVDGKFFPSDSTGENTNLKEELKQAFEEYQVTEVIERPSFSAFKESDEMLLNRLSSPAEPKKFLERLFGHSMYY